LGIIILRMATTSTDWKAEYQSEIDMAEASRLAGNEGRARVCARRAAGIVVGEYFRFHGIECRSASAYDRLKMLLMLPDIPSSARRAAELLLLKVQEDYTLPVEADLIAEARSLRQTLLKE